MIELRPIGVIRSALRDLREAPLQGEEGAPDAWLEIAEEFCGALRGIAAGDRLVVITWLDRGDRETLLVHPRGDRRNPLTGVFATRSPDRPNPLGLHRVTVREVHGARLRIGPIEAIDGTPVVDIKSRNGVTIALENARVESTFGRDAARRRTLRVSRLVAESRAGRGVHRLAKISINKKQ
ncbi:MAG TPA: tRNA (N6-threonylcarbamoyladenosine(37)-N6)-methyltransferase TrmO [Thermoanaerobaculia bacterium]|nr:tRNA (N6-threonylcarbamoyladenosine(37)-N6)-methyltransferase TrmO [Thermoanaerobaculia bacterium]